MAQKATAAHSGAPASASASVVAPPSAPLEPAPLSWQNESPPDAEYDDFEAIFGSSASDIYLVGREHVFTKDQRVLAQGCIFHSADGGRSWQKLSSYPQPLHGVWASSAKDVYVVGEKGAILHSKDGKTFRKEASGTNAWLYGVWGSGPNDVYAVGGNSYAFGEDSHHQPEGDLPGVVLHSTNAGKTWRMTTLGPTALVCVFGNAEGDVYASVSAENRRDTTLFHSQDKGRKWQQVDFGATSAYGLWGTGAELVTADIDGTISRSSDRGATWLTMRVLDRHAHGAWLRGVFGTSLQNMYVVGDHGTILHSVDGGRTFNFDQSGTERDLRSTWGSAANDFFAVGADGTIVHLHAPFEDE